MSYMTVGDSGVATRYPAMGDSGVATRYRSAMGGFTDVLKQGVLTTADLIRAKEQEKAAAAAAAAAPAGGGEGGGFPIMPIVIIGGIGLVAYMLLKKK